MAITTELAGNIVVAKVCAVSTEFTFSAVCPSATASAALRTNSANGISLNDSVDWIRHFVPPCVVLLLGSDGACILHNLDSKDEVPISALVARDTTRATFISLTSVSQNRIRKTFSSC